MALQPVNTLKEYSRELDTIRQKLVAAADLTSSSNRTVILAQCAKLSTVSTLLRNGDRLITLRRASGWLDYTLSVEMSLVLTELKTEITAVVTALDALSVNLIDDLIAMLTALQLHYPARVEATSGGVVSLLDFDKNSTPGEGKVTAKTGYSASPIGAQDAFKHILAGDKVRVAIPGEGESVYEVESIATPVYNVLTMTNQLDMATTPISAYWHEGNAYVELIQKEVP